MRNDTTIALYTKKKNVDEISQRKNIVKGLCVYGIRWERRGRIN